MQGFKELADKMLSYDGAVLKKALKADALIEVTCDEEDDDQGLPE